jgi:TrmH family RNA methyltransferase
VIVQDIFSTQNDTYKNIKHLATSAKWRRRSKQTLVEGIHLCQAYLSHVGQPQICVISQSATENAEAKTLVEALDHETSVILLSDNHFKALSSVENGINILFVVAISEVDGPAVLEDGALLLEDVQDPGNIGAILRTAAAAGVKTVFASSGCASAWAPKTLRAGMGAQFVLTIHENADLPQLISSSSTLQVLATSLEATATIYDHDLAKPTAWLFGNEGQGVSQELLQLAVKKVIIPQNQNVESLNVAAAVAVCLFEQARQKQLS